MPKLTLNLSFKTLARLEEYARNEAGDLPERAASDILKQFFAEDYEVTTDTGELLSDGTDGYDTMINPEYANQVLTFRQAEQEYGKQPGTARKYKSYHPEMVESGDFFQVDGRTWAMKRYTAEKVWGEG